MKVLVQIRLVDKFSVSEIIVGKSYHAPRWECTLASWFVFK